MRLTSSDVAAEAEISYRQLDHWCNRGLVKPRVEADGQGTVREFSDDEMHHVITMARLVRLGFNIKAAAAYSRIFADWSSIQLGNHFQLIKSERGDKS